MWTPTNEEVAELKTIGRCSDLSDEFVSATLPALFDYVQGQCITEFTIGQFPGGLKLFLAHALNFTGKAKVGVKSKKMGTVSVGYDFSELPTWITDFLGEYGFGLKKKRGYARFTAF